MTRFIKNIFGFSLLTLIAYPLIVILWGELIPSRVLTKNLFRPQKNHGFMYNRMQEIRDYRAVDILFLGSSHAYRGFDTRIFSQAGYKTFNLGSSAQTPLQTKILLDRYLDKLNPKLVVYEVYPSTFCSDGIESSLDLISNDENDWDSYKLAWHHKHLGVINTTIFAYYQEMLGSKLEGSANSIRRDDRYIKGGYVEKDIKYFKHQSHPAQYWNLNESQINIFKSIIAKLASENRDAILVQAPITKSLYDSYQNNFAFDSIMSSLGVYHNLNRTIALNDSLHFDDAHHLNQAGVEIFNEKLLNILKNN